MTGLPHLARPEDGPEADEMERLADELRRTHYAARKHPDTDPPIPWEAVDGNWRRGWLACAYLVMSRERQRERRQDAKRLADESVGGAPESISWPGAM